MARLWLPSIVLLLRRFPNRVMGDGRLTLAWNVTGRVTQSLMWDDAWARTDLLYVLIVADGLGR